MIKPIFAIDPGNTESAYCIYAPESHTVLGFAKIPNFEMRAVIQSSLQSPHSYAIEMIASYGMPVGADVFETCLWIGRFKEILESSGESAELVYRKSVKMHLCNSVRAKDSNVRQAIIDQFPAAGGGKLPQVGIKSKPGPLFGVSGDVWAALGVALTFANSNGDLERAA